MITNKMEGPRAAAVRRDVLAARNDQDVALASEPGDDLQSIPLLYDYSQLPAAHQERVRQSAVTIKRTVKRSAVTIGGALAEAKELLNHGQWLDWLQAEFEWSDRTAENAMNAARLVSKNEKFSILGNSVLYMLASPSVPEAAREAAIVEAQVTGKSPKVKRVKEIIKEHETIPQQLARFDREAAARRAENDAKRNGPPVAFLAAPGAFERATGTIPSSEPRTPVLAVPAQSAMTSADRAKLRALIHDIFPLLYLAEEQPGQFGKRAAASRNELELLIGWLD